MVSLYVNKDIPENYKYIYNINNTYFDLYDKQNTIGTSGNFYRVYYGLDEDLYTINTYNHNNSYSGITTTEIKRTDDFLARQDSNIILFNGLSIVIIIILLLNIFTSMFKKGGVLHA